jgi:hypothetical protein
MQTCQRCGNHVRSNLARYCGKCGIKLRSGWVGLMVISISLVCGAATAILLLTWLPSSRPWATNGANTSSRVEPTVSARSTDNNIKPIAPEPEATGPGISDFGGFILIVVASPNTNTVWAIYRYKDEAECQDAIRKFGITGIAKLIAMDPVGIGRIECAPYSQSWGPVKPAPSTPDVQ